MLLTQLFEQPMLGFAFILAVLVALTVHEFAHAFVANLYGDSTAKDLGRLTLNPMAHLDLFGALLFLFIGFGWGKPVPVNSRNFKKLKEGEIMTSLAGPLSNLMLAALSAISFHIFFPQLGPSNLLIGFFLMSFRLNIILMVFNLIPIPPLDGSHLLNNILSDRYHKLKTFLMVYGPQVLFYGIIFAIIANIEIFGWIDDIVHWFATLFNLPK